MSKKMLTVTIRNTFPVRYLNEPVTLRSVHVALTDEQMEQIALRDDYEEISFCFLEEARDDR